MGNLSILDDIMTKRLKSIHVAYLAKVISFNGSRATIQPLQKDTSIIPNVPVARNARYTLKEKTITIESTSFVNLEKKPLQAGNIVICVCCERNISTALKGRMPSTYEPNSSHSLSNSVVVGII